VSYLFAYTKSFAEIMQTSPTLAPLDGLHGLPDLCDFWTPNGERDAPVPIYTKEYRPRLWPIESPLTDMVFSHAVNEASVVSIRPRLEGA
jgi:hypothetical protein